MEFVKSESTVKPIQIDENSSASGVYIRICIEEKQVEDATRYEYLEAFITRSEWEEYKLIAKLKGTTLDAPTIEFNFKMNLPHEYPVSEGGNGFTYRPIWASTIYLPNRPSLVAFPQKLPIAVYDTTDKKERMQKMTLEEYDNLIKFLDDKREEYFEIKKEQQAGAKNG